MSPISTRLTYDEFLNLPEQEGTHYELDEGELVTEPSPTFLHNRIRDRIASKSVVKPGLIPHRSPQPPHHGMQVSFA